MKLIIIHCSKHIESNIFTVQRRATIKQFIINVIKCPTQINFKKEKIYIYIYILIVLRPWKLNLVHNEIPKLNYIFFSSNEIRIKNKKIKKNKKKNNTNSKIHFQSIPFGPRLLMFSSHLLQFHLQALESLSVSCTHLIGVW